MQTSSFFRLISGRKQPWGRELAWGSGEGGGTAEQAAQEANKPEKYPSSISICFRSTTNLIFRARFALLFSSV